MNRILRYTSLALAVFWCASCQKDALVAENAGSVAVFEVVLPGELRTKAENLGDGTTATQLYYAIYEGTSDEAGSKVVQFHPVNTPDQPVTLNDMKATVSFKLVKNKKYDIVFWAQSPDAPYSFDKANATVTVTDSYSNASANDEARDAFYAMVNDYVASAEKMSVPLTRPFAQVNICSDDYKDVVYMGLSMTSEIEVADWVPSRLNMLTGVADTPVSVKFNAAAVPAESGETIEIVSGADGIRKVYDNVSMNYILAGTETANIKKLTARFHYNDRQVVVEVPNVPYKRNYRTNIFGSLFTALAEFNIEVKPVPFDHPDFNIEHK